MTAHAPHHQALGACPNCGTAFDTLATPPNYCPHCGQEAVLHPPSVAEFAHEFVGHYVALEGSLWRTLRLLVLQPGRLTAAYLHGQRRRYVLPLRLYLTASFLFFLALRLAPSDLAPGSVEGAAAHAPAAASAPARAASGDKVVVFSLAGVHTASEAEAARMVKQRVASCDASSSRPCNWFERKASHASEHWLDDPAQAQAAFASHALGIAPYAIFLMLPVFAGLVALAYAGRRMLFGEHLVFGMHLHTFAFLAATLAALLPDAAAPVLGAVFAVYAVRALRVVYGGGWAGTLARASAVAFAYTVLLSLVTAALALWLFLH